MKISLLTSAVLVLVGIVSVSGQEMKKLELIAAPCQVLDTHEIRVPKAEVVTNATGESDYKIKANETWRRTDMHVKRGQKVEITASGIIRWAQDGSDWTFVTPEGTRAPHANHFPHPNAGIGSLILRIGKAIYPTGSTTTIESDDEGLIEFMMNDDILSDNSGHFLVKLTSGSSDRHN